MIILKRDITCIKGDIIVNAANKNLLSGVNSMIH